MSLARVSTQGGLVMNKGLIFAMGSLLVIMSSSGAIDNYNELVERSILSCQMPSRFLSEIMLFAKDIE